MSFIARSCVSREIKSVRASAVVTNSSSYDAILKPQRWMIFFSSYLEELKQ